MKIKDLVGLQGLDYFDQPGTIVAAAHISNWESLKQYDKGGWLDPIALMKLGPAEENIILVAFLPHNTESDEQPYIPDVYILGHEGVRLTYNYPNLPVKTVIYNGENYRVMGVQQIQGVGHVSIDKGNYTIVLEITYGQYKSLEPYFEPEPEVEALKPSKTKKFNTKQEAIQFTDNYINNLTREQAHKLIHPKYVEELDKYIWDLGIGGFYYNKENTLFCHEVLRATILNYALLYIANK